MILYKKSFDNIDCYITQEENNYFCYVGSECNKITNGFTDDEKTLVFLLECIILSYYKKFMIMRELEGLNFDQLFIDA